MITVPREKAPKELSFLKAYQFFNGYYPANCETSEPNSQCYYLEKGCIGCLINPTIVQQRLSEVEASNLHHTTATIREERE